MIMHQLDARMGKMLEDLKGMLVRRRMDVDGILTGPRGAAETPFANGGVWGRGEWEDFRLSLDVPAEGNWYLYATTGREGAWDAINPQFVVRVNGQVKQAFDVNHIRLPLENGAHEDILLQGYCQPSATGLDYPYLKLEMCDVDAELEQLALDAMLTRANIAKVNSSVTRGSGGGTRSGKKGSGNSSGNGGNDGNGDSDVSSLPTGNEMGDGWIMVSGMGKVGLSEVDEMLKSGTLKMVASGGKKYYMKKR